MKKIPTFWKTNSTSSPDFIKAVENITKKQFSTDIEAKIYLDENGYWTDYYIDYKTQYFTLLNLARRFGPSPTKQGHPNQYRILYKNEGDYNLYEKPNSNKNIFVGSGYQINSNYELLIAYRHPTITYNNYNKMCLIDIRANVYTNDLYSIIIEYYKKGYNRTDQEIKDIVDGWIKSYSQI